mgnify:FL=1
MHDRYAKVSRLNAAISETNALYHELAQHFGLSDSVMQVLYTALCQGGSCTVRQVCLLTGISKQTISSALRNMEAQGLVALRAVDGRQKRICLTKAGSDLAMKTAGVELELESAVLEKWGEEMADTYLRLNELYLQGLRRGLAGLKGKESK